MAAASEDGGMPNRSHNLPRDMNQLAKAIVDMATGAAPPVMPMSSKAAAGQLGGLKGGPARARKLSKKRRVEIAKKAAAKRWPKKSK